MPELPAVVPGEPIDTTTFGNPVIARVLSRYVDESLRDFENPLPQSGDFAYITDTGELQVYDGATWKIWARADGADRFTSDPAIQTEGTIQLNVDGAVDVRLREGDGSAGWALSKASADRWRLWDYSRGVEALRVDSPTLRIEPKSGYRIQGAEGHKWDGSAFSTPVTQTPQLVATQETWHTSGNERYTALFTGTAVCNLGTPSNQYAEIRLVQRSTGTIWARGQAGPGIVPTGVFRAGVVCQYDLSMSSTDAWEYWIVGPSTPSGTLVTVQQLAGEMRQTYNA